MMSGRQPFFAPVHPEGYIFLLCGFVATLFLFWIHIFLGLAGGFITVYFAYFFRDPVRVTPQRTGLVISAADGRVCAIKRLPPPEEFGLGSENLLRISVFMNLFDCHVQRMPVAGRVLRRIYTPGRFFNASLDKSSTENERNSLVLEMEGGEKIAVVQIAGLIARRIFCAVDENDKMRAGDKFGLIRFGSRVDVYLPETAVPLVAVGQRVICGETVLADLESQEKERDVSVA